MSLKKKKQKNMLSKCHLDGFLHLTLKTYEIGEDRGCVRLHLSVSATFLLLGAKNRWFFLLLINGSFMIRIFWTGKVQLYWFVELLIDLTVEWLPEINLFSATKMNIRSSIWQKWSVSLQGLKVESEICDRQTKNSWKNRNGTRKIESCFR